MMMNRQGQRSMPEPTTVSASKQTRSTPQDAQPLGPAIVWGITSQILI
jgi:hypothetical protein